MAGIPNSIKQDSLKTTLVKIFTSVGIEDASTSDIEVTHRLKSKLDHENVIVKAKRDFIDKVFWKKKEILEVGRINELNFGVANKLYINEHLSPAYKNLRYNCKMLKIAGIIDDFWFSNSKLKVKLNGETKEITHEFDLFLIDPDFNFTFDNSLYLSLEDHDIDRMDDLAGYAS